MRMELKAPASWKELSREQLVAVATTLRLMLTRDEMLVALFCLLADVKLERDGKSWTLMHGKDVAVIQEEEIADLCGRFAWILDTEPTGVTNMSQADDFIRDLTFEDWFQADTLFRLYEDDGDITHFAEILQFLKETPRKLSDGEATAYRWWWWSVQDFLSDSYPNVLEKKAAGTDPSPYEPFKTLQDFHLLLNDNHPQENDRIDKTNVHDVLSALDNKIAMLRYKQEQINRMKP